jgi:hypothetical protein
MKEEIKAHIEKHKVVYSFTAGGVLFAGITAAIMRGRSTGVRGAPAFGVRGAPNEVSKTYTRPLMFFSNHNTIATIVSRGNSGPPSYMVERLSDGKTWLSQADTALETGVYPSLLSGHLNGKIPDIDGEVYRRIGVAVA